MAIKTFSPDPRPTEVTNKPEVKLLENQFGDGYTQTVGDGINPVRGVFDLSWDVLTIPQADALESFFEAVTKTGEPFNFVRANGRTVKCTCKGQYERKEGTPNTFSATLRQSFLLV